MAGKQIVGATAGGSGIDWNDYLGKLVLFEPLDHEKDINTVHGTSDAIRANVYVLLGPGKVEEIEDTLIFQRVMQGQLKRQIGSVVVGRITQGEAKRGQSAPWVISEPNDTDLKRGVDFWNSRTVQAAKPERQEPKAKQEAPPAEDGWDSTDEGESY
jgi:hypothetical protein